jgi:hypothetical protein
MVAPTGVYRNSAREWSVRYTTEPDTGEHFVRAQYEVVRQQQQGGPWHWRVVDFDEGQASEHLDSAVAAQEQEHRHQGHSAAEGSVPSERRHVRQLHQPTWVGRSDPAEEASKPQWSEGSLFCGTLELRESVAHGTLNHSARCLCRY